MVGPWRLSLMCANRPLPGWVNLDMQSLPGITVRHYIDIVKPRLPFKDDVFEEVYWSQGPEHILNIERMVQELWRVCKDGARWYLGVPGWLSRNSAMDPTHYSRWTTETLQFFTRVGHDSRRYAPALLSYTVRGEETAGLDFYVQVHKPGLP